MSNGNQPIQAPNCSPPVRSPIGNQRREITWINPGGQVLNVTITGGPEPDKYFIDPQRVGNNFQLTFTGGAPPNSVWPYLIQCADSQASATSAAGGTQPELTNGPG
jgi:hypothetical protein